MSETFHGSDEHEDWITETGGSDEERSFYYNKWFRRTQTSHANYDSDDSSWE